MRLTEGHLSLQRLSTKRRAPLALAFSLIFAALVLPAAASKTTVARPPAYTYGSGTTSPATSGVVLAAGDPVVAAAGDIAGSQVRDEATAQLLDSIAPTAVLTLGDNVYPDGTDSQFASYYEPTWGRHKAKTYPSPGNHDYHQAGASGYFNYFGAVAGDPTKGYYAFNLGTWRLYALNSNCSPVPCAAGSVQEKWLRADLAANPRTCTAAFMHHPRFSSGFHGSIAWVSALWSALYDHGADVVLEGHDHGYERFARLSPTGAIDLERGIRSFVVGTGGASLSVPKTPITGSEVRSSTHGVLKMTLHAGGYDWAFVPVAGSTFTDSGSDTCGATPNPGNAAPTVNAGPDQTITPSASAILDGTVNDDGRPNPPATVTTTWSKVSGLGTVTFGNASAADTTAGFSLAGTYVLRLTASDSVLSAFDELTVTVNPANQAQLYFSLRTAGTVGGVSAANEDILFFNGSSSLAFDGSDVGLASLRIDAFTRVDANTLLLSFDAAGSVPGIAGTVDDSDIVRFEATSLGAVTAGSFFLYFDGSDVGLTVDAHDVDAVELLPGGQILLSTTGSVTVSGVSARDEDLLSFTQTSLGDFTAGSFSLHFDGSDVGLGDSSEDVDAAAVDASGKIYLSTTDVFVVPGVSGNDEDVFVFDPTSTGSTTAGSYLQALYFDGSSFGLGANDLFAIDLP